MFNWFSLDIIYYPVSGIMWVWYKAFAFLLGPSNFFAWALSVMFLVFTLRAILYKPFVKQIRTTRQMQELQPQIKALQKKYGKDRQRMALEMQKLQKEHGFNPILGCLPMLAQVPVFIGLFHVLRSFNRTQGGFGQIQLSVEQNRATGNYFFSPTDVAHFLDANLFGAPLGATMIQTSGLDAFTEFSRVAVIAVGVPIMILAGIATYFNSRASIARQSPEAAANPQTAMMNKLALYVFPLGVVVGGPFLPLAVILYWFANNIWTFGQQHIVFGKIEKEEEAKKADDEERAKNNAPPPGKKPKPVPASMDAVAEFKKAVNQYSSGDTHRGTETAALIVGYLAREKRNPAAVEDLDGVEFSSSGLVTQIGMWWLTLPEAHQRTRNAYERNIYVCERITDLLRDTGNGSEFPEREYRSLLNHELVCRYNLDSWRELAKRGERNRDLALKRVEQASVESATAGVARQTAFCVATANYRLQKFDQGRGWAEFVIDSIDALPASVRSSLKTTALIDGGYKPGLDYTKGKMLLVAGAPTSVGFWKRLRDFGANRRFGHLADEGVVLLQRVAAEAEAELGPEHPSAIALRSEYRRGLQQVANLYMRYASSAVAAAIVDEGLSTAKGEAVELFDKMADNPRVSSEVHDAVDSFDAASEASALTGPAAKAAVAAATGKISDGHKNETSVNKPGSSREPGQTPRPGSRPNKRKR